TYGVRATAAGDADARTAWLGIARMRGVTTLAVVTMTAALVLATRPDPLTRNVVLATIAGALPAAAVPHWARRGLGAMTAAAAVPSLRPAVALVAFVLGVHGPGQVLGVPAARFGAALATAALGCVLLRGVPYAGRDAVAGERWLDARGRRPLLAA